MLNIRLGRKRLIAVAIGLLTLFVLVFMSGILVGRAVGIPFVKRDQIWTIGIYSGPSATEMSPHPQARNPVLTGADVTDINATFVADPFCTRHNGQWFMFMEVWNADTGQGDIGLAISDDGLNWNYDQIVIDEAGHLAYPLVFESDGEFFIRTGGELYRATDFPRVWEKAGIPIILGLDATLFQHDGRWWSLGSFADDLSLRLHYTDSLDGEWIPHPANPIIKNDNNFTRPGGRVVRDGDRLLRYAQDGVPYYGLAVNAFEITKLTTTEYEERRVSDVPLLEGSGAGWNAHGMHTIDPHQTGPNEWLACVDGWKFSEPRISFTDE